jgi:hypothetical protein
MSPTSFKFPPHQAVLLVDVDSRQMAVVAPALTPGTHYVGVLGMVESGDKLLTGDFISGPACVLTKNIWRKLAAMAGGDLWDSVNPHICPPVHDYSIPARSLDDFIDLLTGGNQ